MIKKILYAISLFFLFMINAEASTGNLKLDCPTDTVTAGNNITCNVILEVTEGTIDGYQFKINSKLLELNYETNSQLNNNNCMFVRNGSEYQVNNCTFEQPISQTTTLATLTLKSPDKITTTSDQVIFSDIRLLSNEINISRSNTFSKKINITGNFKTDTTSKAVLNVNCPKTIVKPEEILICDVVLNINKTLVDYANFNLNIDNSITYESTNSILENYRTTSNSYTNIMHSSANVQEIGGVIGKITFSSNKAGTKELILNNIEIGYSKDSSILYKTESVKKMITVEDETKKSSINTLSDIKINDQSVKNFDSDKLSYSESIDSSTIVISVEKTDPKSVVIGAVGTKSLKYGLNVLKIDVKSESGETRTYVLNITRNDRRSKDNTLKTLTLDKATINFNPTKTSYKVTVGNEVTEITVNSELSDLNAKYVEGYGNRTVTLNEGINVIGITVEAETGAIKTYSITITRDLTEEAKKTDVSISDLNVKGEKVSNVADDTYEVEIKKGEKLELDVGLLNENATYTIEGNENLTNGSVVTIKVTSEDKSTTKEYKVNVKVKDEEEKEEEAKSKENNKAAMTISIQILGIVIIVESIVKYKLSSKLKEKE